MLFTPQPRAHRQKTGFTLIELLVVATIMIVLTAIGLVSYTQVNQNARNAKRKADIESLRQALVIYRTDLGTYPINCCGTDYVANATSMISTLQSSGYFSGIVQDPKNVTPYTYRYAGAASSFNLCYVIEPSGVQQCVTNP